VNGRNRRRKDVPFNPFAQNAAAERNRRHAEKAKEKRRMDAQSQTTGGVAKSPQKDKAKTLQELQRQAREKLNTNNNTSKVESVSEEQIPATPEPVVEKPAPEPTISETTATVVTKKPQQTREERLEELKRKSQQSKDNAKLSKSQIKHEQEVATKPLEAEVDTVVQTDENESVGQSSISEGPSSNSLNVFKTIQSVDKSSAGISKKKRKTRRMDKKGGGRQRLEKKLNRQKILEFKYVAREILDNPDVPEEHRSNVLGQIIAKGERISIDAAMEFIEQKNRELILTDEIADKLRSEIKSISTRR
tara:strand:- start:2216 stop:3130 length:915 start_codon:yes stop_codon:yes gene_type:complete